MGEVRAAFTFGLHSPKCIFITDHFSLQSLKPAPLHWMLMCSAVPKAYLTRPNCVCPWKVASGAFQSLTMSLWSFSPHNFDVFDPSCYSRNIMETRDNGSQFTIVALKPAFPSSEIMISLVMWQWNRNDGQLSAFLLSAGAESFSYKLLRKPVNPSAGHSPLSRDFWAVWLLWCSPAAWEGLGPLCFRIASCFPLDVDTTARTSDLKTGI